MSCSKENNSTKQGFTYSNFENNLKSDMNYNSIVAKFGEPSNDIGSGIHIYVYQLIDSTEIWIGYADKIIYARHMDKNQQILNTIIEDKPYSLTYDYFKDNLKPDMIYNSIVAKFGEPSNDIGSGIHIYVYQLIDSTEIWIGYADKIIYVRHMDKNHQIIENII
jgi:shikimate 5-dehydrogenase